MSELVDINLSGRRIVITGGSMGIGYAIAEECSLLGAGVSLVARNEENLQQAKENLANQSANHSFHCVNVSDPEHVHALSKELASKFGKVDGLVNCAGLYGAIGRIDETDPVEFANAINVNLLGTYYMCRFIIPLMRGSERGKIVNYSGGGGSSPLPNYSAYACSKAAVIRLTENMSSELSDNNIDVNVVAPGFVATNIHLKTLEVGEKAGKEFYENTKKQMDEKNASPEPASQLSAFLLSPNSNGISGKLISAIWDPWQEFSFQEKLRGKNFATLRRIDEKYFSEKNV